MLGRKRYCSEHERDEVLTGNAMEKDVGDDAGDLEYDESDYNISIPGLKHRLRRLEKKAEYQDIEAVLAAISEIHEKITDARHIELFEKLGFSLPSVDPNRTWRPLFIPPCVSNRVPIFDTYGPYDRKREIGYRSEGKEFPDNILERAADFEQRAKAGRSKLEFWQRLFDGVFSTEERARKIALLRDEEVDWWRLQRRFKPLLKRWAKPLTLGFESKWPEIVKVRAEIAEREGLRDKKRRAEIYILNRRPRRKSIGRVSRQWTRNLAKLSTLYEIGCIRLPSVPIAARQ